MGFPITSFGQGGLNDRTNLTRGAHEEPTRVAPCPALRRGAGRRVPVSRHLVRTPPDDFGPGRKQRPVHGRLPGGLHRRDARLAFSSDRHPLPGRLYDERTHERPNGSAEHRDLDPGSRLHVATGVHPVLLLRVARPLEGRRRREQQEPGRPAARVTKMMGRALCARPI